MNYWYSKAKFWVLPAVAVIVVLAAILYLMISDAGRGLVGLGTGSVSCQDLTMDTGVTGMISGNSKFGCFLLDSSDPSIKYGNVSLKLTSQSGTSLDADLYAPGSEVALGNTGYAWITATGKEPTSGTLALDKGSGKYKVKVWSYSNDLGGYEFSVSAPASPASQTAAPQASEPTTACNAVSLDSVVSGNIGGSNKFDCYTFTASQNDNVVIKMTSKDGTPLDADLYAPGTPVTEVNTGFKYITASSETSEITLSTSLDKGDGAYRVKAWSYGNAAEGNYELTISLNSGTTAATPSISETCGVLKIGDSISGTISSGDKYDCYKYSAKSGDVITVDITSLSGAQLDADIFGPGSSTYADGAGYYWVSTQGTSKISKPVTLDKGDGEYIIKAWSYGNTATGDYKLKISTDSEVKSPAELLTTPGGASSAEAPPKTVTQTPAPAQVPPTATPTLGPPANVATPVDMSPRPCNAPEIPISTKWKEVLESASFTKCMMPFGVLIGADYRVPDSYITQVAMTVAEILDPDMDGTANDPRVLAFVTEYEDAWLPMPADRESWNDYLEGELDSKLGSYGLMIPKWWMVEEGEFSDSGPDEHAKAVMVEEIVHFMTQFGYSRAYPHIFGVEDWDSIIAKEAKRASCDWWQHPENDCPGSPGYPYGDCSVPSCDVTEFYQQVVITRAGMTPGWRGIGFPGTEEELEAKLSDEMRAAMDEPKHNQISKPLTFSYSVNAP